MKTFPCSVCKLHYTEEKWAKQCEEFCRKHKNLCGIDIIRHAIGNRK